jgi:small conductance mechanosensitive channel
MCIETPVRCTERGPALRRRCRHSADGLPGWRVSTIVLLVAASCNLLCGSLQAQNPAPAGDSAVAEPEAEPDGSAPEAPVKVDVAPLADDQQIAERLERILTATQWFEDSQVAVEEGVVFLSGRTDREEYKEWAGNLARNTQDVVAVVNRVRVIEGPWWDLAPAWEEVRSMGRDAVQSAPLVALGLLLLVLTWYAARTSIVVAGHVFQRRMSNQLLRQVAARAVAIPVFLIGLYLVLRIAGLTQMAATVIGGTGLAGLVIGIAFRDIAENFLASLLISTQRPFAIDDLIEVEGYRGYVQSVTTRGTVLMMLDGNHVQIPNSTIYKATIRNLTANPRSRQDFAVGIGYDDSIARAQETALAVLRAHPAVLDDPESLALVEALAASTVNVRVYFWIDGSQHSVLKVRSSVIRQIKAAFEDTGISMPDEAREVVFPNEVPVRILGGKAETENGSPSMEPTRTASRTDARSRQDDECLSTPAEGNLASETDQIRRQAQASRNPEEGTNLLEDAPPPQLEN